MRSFTSLHVALAGLTLATLTACDSTGPNTRPTRVTLSQGAVAAAAPALAAELLPNASATPSQAPPLSVASIEVTVTGVDALPLGGDEQGGWVSLQVTAPASLDLLLLPTETENGLLLAQGDLPVGDYGNLRIRFSDAFVTFSEEVRVGQAVYPADEPIAVFVPSGAQVGIKVPHATFTVSEEVGGEVALVFDPEQSAANVVVTGADTVILTPVLGVRP